MPPAISTLLRAVASPRPDASTPTSPPAVPRHALVFALAAVTATYLLLDQPAADPGLRLAAVITAPISSSQTINATPIAYYDFINPIRLVYEE